MFPKISLLPRQTGDNLQYNKNSNSILKRKKERDSTKHPEFYFQHTEMGKISGQTDLFWRITFSDSPLFLPRNSTFLIYFHCFAEMWLKFLSRKQR